jgi:hypothetical protein
MTGGYLLLLDDNPAIDLFGVSLFHGSPVFLELFNDSPVFPVIVL